MSNQYQYDHREIACPAKFLTTQSAGNILATRPQIVGPNGTEDGVAKRFTISEFSFQNRSGVEAIVGIGVRLPITLWTAGQWDDSSYAAGTVYADDTTDAQDAGSDDFALETLTNDDGFAICSPVPFNVVSVLVTTPSASNAVWAMYYSKATAGTGFSSNYNSIDGAFVQADFAASGENLIWFPQPNDWVKTSAATAIANRHGAGLPEDRYVLVVKATTAPDATAGLANLLVVGHAIYCTEQIADGKVAIVTNEGETPLLPQGDALVAVCSKANAGNRADVKFRMRA